MSESTPTRGGIMPAATLAPCRASASPVNPNAGKRKPGTHVRKPRTSGPRSTVTITTVDPSYLRRYGTLAAQASADRAQRAGQDSGAGDARVVTRSATARTLRAGKRRAAEAVARETVAGMTARAVDILREQLLADAIDAEADGRTDEAERLFEQAASL